MTSTRDIIKKLITRHASDRRMVKDCARNYSHFSFDKNSVVLDLGANIGGLAALIGDTEIAKYIGVEADLDNFNVLKENVSNILKCDTVLFHAAATTSKEKTVAFYRSPEEIGSTNGQTNPNDRQKLTRTKEAQVKNKNISSLLKKYEPTHLKMDIKGTEMCWFEETGGAVPDCVQEMFVEVYTKKMAQKFDAEFYPRISQDFDLAFCYPTVRFVGMGDKYHLPNLGLPDQNAQLYDVNILVKRKR